MNPKLVILKNAREEFLALGKKIKESDGELKKDLVDKRREITKRAEGLKTEIINELAFEVNILRNNNELLDRENKLLKENVKLLGGENGASDYDI